MTTVSFTKQGYRHVLDAALASGYEFLTFDDQRVNELERLCLLRHDVDADLHAAYELAKIDADVGVTATFFLMLRSPIYNLFSRANHRYVQHIMALGHAIGLHYDEGFSPGDQHDLQGWINTEATVIEKIFATAVKVVSFHQPSSRILNNEVKLTGYVNTYDAVDMAGIQYISDSSKVWQREHVLDIFRDRIYPKVQLLIHPMWWASDEDDPAPAVWERTLIGNFMRAQEQILATERAYGAKRELVIRVVSS